MTVIPVEKNADYSLHIIGFGSEGEGVGKIDNFTIFVPGALQGEDVTVKIVKVAKNYAVAKLLSITCPSEQRTTEQCSIYKRCGGCNLQHMTYEGQLKFKKNRVLDCINRIGKVNNNPHNEVVVHDTIGMDHPYRYRNKVQLPVGIDGSDIKIGFYAKRSHEIIDMEQCIIQNDEGDEVAALIKKWYMAHSACNNIRHIMIRKAFATDEIMVVIVTSDRVLNMADELITLLVHNIKGLKSIIHNINEIETNVVLGRECITLWGNAHITDYIGKYKFRISPLSFFQVNPVQTEVLYNSALEYAGLTGNEIVFDAYCGTGTISLFLSQKAKKVYGVEIIPAAIEDAKENAVNNGVDNVEFLVGKAEEIIPELIAKGIKADVVVVDPPRKGCDIALIKAVSEMNPERIIYVSCDPATLARDLKLFSESGYDALEIQPVDMFPQTHHVENIAKLERRNEN